jgi:predicted chitinase
MGYVDTLSQEAKNNINLLIAEAKKQGITNPISIAGMLAVISKESGFIPTSEKMNYSASRLMEVFNLSSSKANQLANKPKEIANYVYGAEPHGKRTKKGALGNYKPNDGWDYRGRGFNQLTFRGNYEDYKDTAGVDIISKPDRVNEPNIAKRISVKFFLNGFNSLKNKGKLSAYGNANDINDFKDTKNSALAFYHVNSGTGNEVSKIKSLASSDTVGGMSKTLSRVDDLLKYVKANYGSKEPKNDSKNGISYLGIFLGIAVGALGFFLVSNKIIK